MNLEIFPLLNQEEARKDPLGYQAFGKRFVSDQSLYEYLLEFLLVFSSAKAINDNDEYYLEYEFHKDDAVKDSIRYYVDYRIALRRFVFFEKSKREGQFKLDMNAYEDLLTLLEKKVRDEEASNIINNIQDLMYGFSVILKNRSWFAQSLLPLVPEFIFGESMGEKKVRDKIIKSGEDYNKLDTEFQFGRHNFFSRGGEAYYLHVLKSTELYPEYRKSIEDGLKRLVCQVDQLSELSNFIQNSWEQEHNITRVRREAKCGYIPNGYEKRSEYTCMELSNYLAASINCIDKVDVLAKGIILQIIRMFHVQARERVKNPKVPYWVIDMKSGSKNVRDYSERSFRIFVEDTIAALYVGTENLEYIRMRLTEGNNRLSTVKKEALSSDDKLTAQLLSEGADESYKVMKKLGKEIKLIIPIKGDHERFSLSEDLMKFLVLSLLRPKQKVRLEEFMSMLFEQYGMIIGRNHMKKYCAEEGIDESEASYFAGNEHAFKEFVSNCGFLRELSDATSIVFNPYEEECESR